MPPKFPSPQPQVALTSAVQVGLAGPTSESASEPPSESGALRASPECSASSSGGGARDGESEWRRGRGRLRAGIAPAQAPRIRQPLGNRTGTASGGGALPAGGGALRTGAGPQPEETRGSRWEREKRSKKTQECVPQAQSKLITGAAYAISKWDLRTGGNYPNSFRGFQPLSGIQLKMMIVSFIAPLL